MKFGKRLAAEAARKWRPFYLDYKSCKRAIQHAVSAQDASGRDFDIVLRQELHKVSTFYLDKEAELEAAMASFGQHCPAALASFRSEVTDLRKFAVLNYIAVIKAVKKRNRHLRAACGRTAGPPLRALDLLSQQYFFTSPRLAALSTRAELLDSQGVEAAAEEYVCPICLDTLHSPVILTCAHRFCWGCLLAHCAVAQRASARKAKGLSKEKGEEDADICKGSNFLPAAKLVPEESGTSAAATYDCPVCRKAHLLDLDRLQVDQHLNAFVERLRHRGASEQQHAHPAPSSEDSCSTEGRSTAPPAPVALPATPSTASGNTIHLVCEVRAPATPAGAPATQAAEAVAVPAPPQRRREAEPGLPPRPPPMPRASLAAAAEVASGPEAMQVQATLEDSAESRPALPQPAAGPAPAEPPLLPPQAPELAGRLTVVLDLDGTLVSSYTPRRAPALPPGSVSYTVGRGGQLNPGGVFVVERPGLTEFFAALNEFAEVVLFTAGLEDYARPIADELDARHSGAFAARLYRPATTACAVYPCLKDLGRLGRDLARTVLVDDTPLAFLRQPDNGIPIFNFRGDCDDRVLMEAILPLLQSLAPQPDVRPLLKRRFDMRRWFLSQGVAPEEGAATGAKAKRRLAMVPRPALGPARAAAGATAAARRAASRTLLLCDFDMTLTDFDAGERIVGELAPELLPQLTALEMPANFVPATNAVLSEMARRGLGREQLLGALRALGEEVPAASTALLRWAASAGMDVRVLSDCNSVFIGHILTGAKVNTLVKSVTTNVASFERAPAALADSALDLTAHCGEGAKAPPGPASHRLVIRPRHNDARLGSHGCPLCPANLCKGQELEALRRDLGYGRVVYCGDGANDLCPALALTSGDVLLARAGHRLAALLEERACSGAAGESQPHGGPVVAQVLLWRDHAELLRLVQQVTK